MRTVTFFCLVLSMFILGCAPKKASPIEGTWKIVNATWVRADTLVGQFPGNWTGGGMKIWSKGYFAFVGRYKADTSFGDTYGGGRYKLDGDRYDEILQYHVVTGMVGDTVKMLLEVKDDTLVQTWPISTNGQIDKKNFQQEKYVRLD